MISYYCVEDIRTDSIYGKIYLISNMRDRREVKEQDLINYVASRKIVLTNYQLSSTGTNRLVPLRTNIIIPQEKQFQHIIMEELLQNNLIGKQVVIQHINKVKNIISLDKDATIDKFIDRLLKVVNLYLSYMHDTKVKFLIISEHKTVKFDSTVIKIKLNNIATLAQSVGMMTDFSDFSSKYDKDIDSYSFLVDLSHKLLTRNRKSVLFLMDLIRSIIKDMKYTFVGEQMDKYFCIDLLEKYKKSVFDNVPLDLSKLTAAEREAKANECVKYFGNGYDKFDYKIRTDRKNIINAINSGGQQTQLLLDNMNKLNSLDIERTNKLNNSTNNDKYKEMLVENCNKTAVVINTINEQLKRKNLNNVMNALSIALSTGSAAMLSFCENSSNSSAVAPMAASAVGLSLGSVFVQDIKCGKETRRVMAELSDYSIDNNLPKDIGKILKEIREISAFNYLCILYCYERALFKYTVNNYMCKKKFGSRNHQTEFKEGVELFKKDRDKHFKKISSSILIMDYNNSYIKALADLMGEDDKWVRTTALYYIDTDCSAEPVPELKYTEMAWLSACRLIYDKVDNRLITSNQMENQLFWKIFEDTFTVKEYMKMDKDRKEFLSRLRKAFNETYSTQFKPSNKFKIDVTQLILN